MGTSIQGIQYLRAIAALMVVLFHARPLIDPTLDLSIGARGVDIFFVISGFIIAHAHRHDRPGPDRSALRIWSTFVIKRLIRVVPLYWLALSATLLVMQVKHQPFQDVWLDYLFWPHWNAEQPGKIFPAFVPGWTLNAEMFFYAVFSITVIKPALRPIIALVLSLLVALGLSVSFDHPVARFYTSSIFAAFILGYLLQQRFEHWRKKQRMPAPALGWIALGAGFAGLYWGRQTQYALLTSLFAALIVAGGLTAWGRLVSRLWHHLGDASYAIYLTHLFSFSISRRVIEWTGAKDSHTLIALGVRLLICMLVATLLGWVVHRWIEQPLLNRLRARLLPTGASS